MNNVVTVIMPALNEERNISLAIDNVIQSFKDFNITGEIVVVNDGSTDKTEEIVNNIISKEPSVTMIRHTIPYGIGASFWEGVDKAYGDFIVMLPGDNENDPWEIFRYYNLLQHVDVVIPFVYNKEKRSLARNLLSFIYRFIINTTFLVYFNYTNGTIFYRKSVLKTIEYRSNGFFFQTDILIRLVKKGYLFAEVPYKLGMRKIGISKATTFPSFLNVIKGYIKLVKDFYFSNELDFNKNTKFPKESATSKRRNNSE